MISLKKLSLLFWLLLIRSGCVFSMELADSAGEKVTPVKLINEFDKLIIALHDIEHEISSPELKREMHNFLDLRSRWGHEDINSSRIFDDIKDDIEAILQKKIGDKEQIDRMHAALEAAFSPSIMQQKITADIKNNVTRMLSNYKQDLLREKAIQTINTFSTKNVGIFYRD